MSSHVMNFLVHEPVGRLEASSREPKKRTWRLRRLPVVRNAQRSSGTLRCGQFWLPRSPAMSALLRRMEAFFWTFLPKWSIACCIALRTRLSRLRLFGRTPLLSGLPSRLCLGLFGRTLCGSLCSPLFRLGALPVALLLLAALFLQLVAFGHPAHWIQPPGQRLRSHPPCWEDLLATRLGGSHGHDPS